MSGLREVRLKNFFCFVGECSVTLEDGVYAVTATHVDDAGRSNWLGKSTFLSAIPFALYGWHKAHTEDDFITDGASESEVVLHFDDVSVRRSRKRGKSTQLEVTVHHQVDENGDTPVVLNGPEAQEFIERSLVGMGEEDFFHSCFFEQKKMAEFVLARPGERMEIVSAWFRLAPLQACAERVGAKLSVLFDEDLKRTHRTEFVRKLLADTLAGLGVEKPEELQSRIAQFEEVARGAREALAASQAQHEKVTAWRVAQTAASDLARVVAEGKVLKARVDERAETQVVADLHAAQASCDECGVRVAQAEKRVVELSRVAAGKFDGACPLVAIQCPATKQINDERARSREQRDAAVVERDAAKVELGKRQTTLGAARSLATEFTRDQATLDGLRKQAMELKEKAKLAKGDPPADSDMAVRLADVSAAEVALQAARKAYADMKAWEAELVTIDDQRRAAADEITLYRYAQLVFGRNGAQRIVAEGALARIEADANTLLAAASIDLEIEVRWSREGSGLASHCDGCGSPFPASQKVKVCPRCSAQRGQKTVDKLEIELSDRSGAAEDLAGIAFQLAASAWLRAERQSAWAVAGIDEPFGALDETNRRALATHFSTLLRSQFGFAQAFVVAHDRGIMDAMPNKVEIVASDAGSKFRLP